jgi:hypothetical protein
MTTRRQHSQLSTALILGCFVFGALVGCKEEPPASLYNPNGAAGATPVLTAISGPTIALAGIDTLTITGTNFSAVVAEDQVYFNSTVANILTASSTQLIVKAPVVVGDTIAVKVAVAGAELFSNSLTLKLGAAVVDVPDILADDDIAGITCDTAGNLYASMISKLAGIGVKKFAPGAKLKEDYSPVFSSSVNRWPGMKFGPGGYLYAVGRNAIFRIPPGGGSAGPWAANVIPNPGLANDLDFDNLGNLWVAGTNTSVISRVRVSDRNVKTFPFSGTVRSVRVYNGYVYVAGRVDSIEGVWRFRIVSADSAAPAELFYSYAVNSPTVYAVTFSDDGFMYLGTGGSAGVYIVPPGGTAQPLYPPLLKPDITALAWGKGGVLFAARGGTVNDHGIVKVETRKASAPYFGMQ